MKRPTPFSVRQYNYIENFLNFMGNYREVLSAIWENFRVVLFVLFGLRGGNCSIVCLWLYAGCGICHSPKVKNRSIYQGLPYNCKKTAKQDREGRIHYSEEELIRYMAVSPMMGRRLLPYAENGEHQLLLGNRRENRGFSVEKLRSVIPGGHVYGVACSHVYSVGRTIWLKSTYAGILFLWRKRFFYQIKNGVLE